MIFPSKTKLPLSSNREGLLKTFKNYRMKTIRLHSASVDQSTRQNLWDEFTQYLDSIYFDGASEVLDQELISFEYNQFISSIAS